MLTVIFKLVYGIIYNQLYGLVFYIFLLLANNELPVHLFLFLLLAHNIFRLYLNLHKLLFGQWLHMPMLFRDGL